MRRCSPRCPCFSPRLSPQARWPHRAKDADEPGRRGADQILGLTEADPARIEFEMLCGVTPERLQALRDQGYRTRVYLPYGREWYLYFYHRLAEYPPNIYQAIADMAFPGGR